MIKNLPQGWRVEKLDDIVFFQEGPGVRNTQFRNEGVKLLNVGNINDNKINLDATKIYISEEEAYGKYSHFLVDDGDLLIACSGIVVETFHKKISFISNKDLPLCLNTSTMRFKTLDEQKLNINFYKYFLMSDIFKHQLQKLITGSAQLNFGPSHIKKMFAPLPPLSQQEKIVKVLDNSSSLVEQQKQLIEKYDVFLKSKFIEMFGDPITNPMGWEVKQFSKLMKIRRGASPRPIKQFIGNDVPWIKIGDATQGNELYIEDTKVKIIKEGVSKSVFLKKGSLIFANCGVSLGFSRILKIDGCIHDGWLSFEDIDSKLNQIFLLKYINHSTQSLRDGASGGTQPNLNIDIMKKFTIYLPPIELQNKFASIVEKIEAIKEKETQKLNHLETLHVSLMDKAFKGEIG